MMNIHINLLPVAKKTKLDYIVNFLLAKDALEIVVLVCSLLAGILVWSWVFLQENYTSLAQTAALVDREYSGQNQDIKNINLLTKNINLSSRNFVPLGPKIKEFASLLPPDIKTNYIRLDRQAQTLVINGTAKTRNALLNFQNVLNNVDWISQVETPASQLFQKENINFEFKTRLKNLIAKPAATNPIEP